MIYLAYSDEGQHRAANDPDYLAQILARSVAEVQAKIDECIAADDKLYIIPGKDNNLKVRQHLKKELADRRTLFNEIRDEANRIRKWRAENDREETGGES